MERRLSPPIKISFHPDTPERMKQVTPTEAHAEFLASWMLAVRNEPSIILDAISVLAQVLQPGVEAVVYDFSEEFAERLVQMDHNISRDVIQAQITVFEADGFTIAGWVGFAYKGNKPSHLSEMLVRETILDIAKENGVDFTQSMMMHALSSDQEEQKRLNRTVNRNKGRIDEDLVAKFRSEMDAAFGTWEGGEHDGTHERGAGDSGPGS